jgi:nicotinamidase-related amidase
MRHPALLAAEQSVLVLVDIQERLMPVIAGVVGGDSVGGDRVVQNSALLVQAAQILGVPVLATTQYATRLGGLVEPLASLLPSISPYDKMTFSAAQNAPFCDGLASVTDGLASVTVEKKQRKQIVLCGVETHICILQTAADLLAMGYQVYVCLDATGSRTSEKHQAGVDRLHGLGIACPPAESVLYEWLQQAGTPEFKQILPLVK